MAYQGRAQKQKTTTTTTKTKKHDDRFYTAPLSMIRLAALLSQMGF